MSVIAKLIVRDVTRFGTGQLIDLGCICENDLMAAYAPSEQDRLFTRYSPWGEMKVHAPEGALIDYTWEPHDGVSQGRGYYVMALHEDEHEFVASQDGIFDDVNFPGSAGWARVGCHSLTDFGGDSRRVEFRGGGQSRNIDKLNWRMSVDNPAASDQFKPGAGYWVVLYDAAKFDMHQAIAAAHGRVRDDA